MRLVSQTREAGGEPVASFGLPARPGVSEHDLILITRVQQGDHAAYEILFKTFYEKLHVFARRVVRSSHIAEEIIQDVFFDIWIRRDRWHPSGSLKAYLYRAVCNKALDHLKHARVEQRWVSQYDPGNDQQNYSPDELTRVKELQIAVDHAVDALPERCRLVFVLTRLHGLTYAETATVLGISVNTVEVQMGRALKSLRNRLAAFFSGF